MTDRQCHVIRKVLESGEIRGGEVAVAVRAALAEVTESRDRLYGIADAIGPRTGSCRQLDPALPTS